MSGVVVVGDALLDRDVHGRVSRICPDAPVPVLDEQAVSTRPGGAGLAASLSSSTVTLVTAVHRDAAGAELRSALQEAGVRLIALPAGGATAEKIRLRSDDRTLLRLDRGGPSGPIGSIPGEVAGAFRAAGAILVADYGRGVAAHPAIRELLSRSQRPIVWDPHPRGADPVPGAELVTPNAAELLGHAAADGPLNGLAAAARRALASWAAKGVVVTLGSRGALLVSGDGPPLVVPLTDPSSGDTCGAGDCFAVRLADHLAAGALPSEAVTQAVQDAARFVAGGAAAGFGQLPLPDPVDSSAAEVADRVRRRGGSVIATGGCFDLLHAGHVSLLRAARALGDCLVVCINSDESVRRLKGPGRPLNHQTDRATTLAALDCVDAVEIFEEDTPEAVIRRLRPHVWAKGGDYDGRQLPEAATLAEWGGQAVILPYLPGRSTSDLVKRAAKPVS